MFGVWWWQLRGTGVDGVGKAGVSDAEGLAVEGW